MPTATPDATSSTSRDARVAGAVERWTGQLIDLTRRNNLLFYKDLKTQTLDLADADADYKARLLAGQPVRASRLYTTAEAFQSARRRLTEIKKKMRLLSEERGIDTGFVAVGMLSWQAPQLGRAVAVTRSPVLLRSLTIQPKGLNAADFELVLEDSAELNPVLSYALTRQVGVNTTDLAESIAETDNPQQLAQAVKLVQQRAADAGVAITFESKLVAAVFAYEKLPMVRDLEESIPLLASHPITSALAGDPGARAELQRRPEPPKTDLNMLRPESEHLVIDADPSQQAAIGAILSESDLILQRTSGQAWWYPLWCR